jgi:hypothetical protein
MTTNQMLASNQRRPQKVPKDATKSDRRLPTLAITGISFESMTVDLHECHSVPQYCWFCSIPC